MKINDKNSETGLFALKFQWYDWIKADFIKYLICDRKAIRLCALK